MTTPRRPNLRRKLAIYGLLLGLLIAGAGVLSDPRFRSSGRKQVVRTSGSGVGTGSSSTPAGSEADSSAAKPPPAPVFDLFGPSGPSAGVDRQLLESLAIPADHIGAVNELVKSFWQQESARLKPRWAVVAAETDGQRKTLLAKGDPGDASFTLQSLKARLRNSLDAGSAERLLPYLSGPMAFGSLGKNPIKVTLTRAENVTGETAPRGDAFLIGGDVMDGVSGATLFSFRAATPEAVQAWLGSSLEGQTPPP